MKETMEEAKKRWMAIAKKSRDHQKKLKAEEAPKKMPASKKDYSKYLKNK